jgi:hypothetical protein
LGERSHSKENPLPAYVILTREVICLDFFLDIVGAVFAADLVAASLTGKFISIGRGGESTTPVQSPLIRLAPSRS